MRHPYFRTNRKLFRATDFIAELLQHLPDYRAHLIRRYGLCYSRSRGTWLRTPHRVRLATEGWKQDPLSQPPVPIGPSDQPYPDGPITSRESHAAWARLLAKVHPAYPLVCGRCGSPMRILAVISEPEQVRRILRHLLKTGKAPPGLDPASETDASLPYRSGIGPSLLAFFDCYHFFLTAGNRLPILICRNFHNHSCLT